VTEKDRIELKLLDRIKDKDKANKLFKFVAWLIMSSCTPPCLFSDHVGILALPDSLITSGAKG